MNIQSEIGALKKVIVHRPLDSLRRLTPQNCHQFLFDDVLWPERAASEHEVFEGVLAEQGAEVYLLHELLAETLAIPEAKAFLINQMMNIRFRHTRVESLLSQYLAHLSPKELVSHILGGMTYREIGQYSLGLCSTIAAPNDFLLPPLPNHMFTRDTSCWIGEGVAINSMAFPARQGETANMAAIYKYHPLFVEDDFKVFASLLL